MVENDYALPSRGSSMPARLFYHPKAAEVIALPRLSVSANNGPEHLPPAHADEAGGSCETPENRLARRRQDATAS